jgi:Co/Zn/Cd efflux system component
MSADCCPTGTFDGASPKYRRALMAVIAINAVMCIVETGAGVRAQSQALQADALDFLADTITYSVSLWVIGAAATVRARAAIAKGTLLLLTGAWVLASTLYRVFTGASPEADVMGAVGAVALAANLTSVVLLLRFRDGDANVRSVWLCSRNDAIGNVAVLAAAAGVWGTATMWPDVLVAGVMATLFVSSAVSILRQAFRELRFARIRGPVGVSFAYPAVGGVRAAPDPASSETQTQ